MPVIDASQVVDPIQGVRWRREEEGDADVRRRSPEEEIGEGWKESVLRAAGSLALPSSPRHMFVPLDGWTDGDRRPENAMDRKIRFHSLSMAPRAFPHPIIVRHPSGRLDFCLSCPGPEI